MISDEAARIMARTAVEGIEAMALPHQMVAVVILGELEPGRDLRHTLLTVSSNVPTGTIAEVLELALQAADSRTQRPAGSA